MPSVSPFGDGDIDVLHRLDDAAPGGELDGEVADVEQRRRGHVRLICLNMIASENRFTLVRIML